MQGAHPATSLSPFAPYRCRERPVLDAVGTGNPGTNRDVGMPTMDVGRSSSLLNRPTSRNDEGATRAVIGSAVLLQEHKRALAAHRLSSQRTQEGSLCAARMPTVVRGLELGSGRAAFFESSENLRVALMMAYKVYKVCGDTCVEGGCRGHAATSRRVAME